MLKQPASFPSSKSAMVKREFEDGNFINGKCFYCYGSYYYIFINSRNVVIYLSDNANLSDLRLLSTVAVTDFIPHKVTKCANSLYILGQHEETRDYEYPYIIRLNGSGNIAAQGYLGRNVSGMLRGRTASDIIYYNNYYYFLVYSSSTYEILRSVNDTLGDTQVYEGYDGSAYNMIVIDDLDMILISHENGYSYFENGTTFVDVELNPIKSLFNVCYNPANKKIYGLTQSYEVISFTPKENTYTTLLSNVAYNIQLDIIYCDNGKYVAFFASNSSNNNAYLTQITQNNTVEQVLLSNNRSVFNYSNLSYNNDVMYVSLWDSDVSYKSDYGIYVYEMLATLPTISSLSSSSQSTYTFIKAK